MCDIDDDGRVTTDAFRHAVRDVAANALDQVLGGSGGGVVGDARTPLFVRSADRSTPGSYDVRPVFLHPPSMDGTTGTRRPGYEARYRDILAGLSYPEDIAVHVSEPVAIVAGAEHYGLLPPSSAGTTSVLVIDVGGTSTCVSLVADDEGGVKYSSTLPLGGETPIDLLVRRLAENFYGPSSLGGGEDDGGDIDDSMANVFTTRPKLDDPAALQRLHEASVAAIRELSNKTRTEINLPYLTMNMTTRQPRHLRTDISRNVVDAAMENWVASVLVPRLLRQQALDDGGSVLSRALPPPADLSTLFASIIARCLENTSQTPLALRAVLLVGGGARMPLVRDSMRGCVGYLAGDTYASKRLIMPEGEMGDELAALGGAVWGSRRGS
jgi:molecular chaperone DnaK (HSP70)